MQCAPQGTGSQIDHKRELLLQEQVSFDDACTISKAALASLQELEQLLLRRTVNMPARRQLTGSISPCHAIQSLHDNFFLCKVTKVFMVQKLQSYLSASRAMQSPRLGSILPVMPQYSSNEHRHPAKYQEKAADDCRHSQETAVDSIRHAVVLR